MEMDRHMKDSLDHWLTTDPRDNQATTEEKRAELAELAADTFLETPPVLDKLFDPPIQDPMGDNREWLSKFVRMAFLAGYECGTEMTYNEMTPDE